MVLFSLTGRHLGTDKRQGTEEMEEEHVRPQDGRKGLYVIV